MEDRFAVIQFKDTLINGRSCAGALKVRVIPQRRDGAPGKTGGNPTPTPPGLIKTELISDAKNLKSRSDTAIIHSSLN